MKRMSKWLVLVLLATAFVLIGGCGRTVTTRTSTVRDTRTT